MATDHTMMRKFEYAAGALEIKLVAVFEDNIFVHHAVTKKTGVGTRSAKVEVEKFLPMGSPHADFGALRLAVDRFNLEVRCCL